MSDDEVVEEEITDDAGTESVEDTPSEDEATEDVVAEEDADGEAESADGDVDDSASVEDEPVEAPPAERYGCPLSMSRDQEVIHPSCDAWFEVATAMLADGWTMCVDLTAVDYLSYDISRNLPAGVKPERFEVVASFLSHGRRDRIRARVQVADDDPTIASIYQLYPGTDHLEREVYDMFGIEFEGHPDLSRILMPETWEGHPLRKDFAVGSIPIQFKAGR